MTRIVQVGFRWPVKQTGPNSVEVLIPMGKDGTPILNSEFALENKLSERELADAEQAVLREVAIIR